MQTQEIMDRFNAAFQEHRPDYLEPLIAETCIIENTGPSPDGALLVGKAACLKNWQQLAQPNGQRFELEETVIFGERAVIRWKYYWGSKPEQSVRGVNLMWVENGQIVRAMGYVKA